MKQSATIHWFRRDLRLEDNAALYNSLVNHNNVIPLFIFDKHILDQLEDKYDARVSFIYETVAKLKDQLQQLGSDVIVEYGYPGEVFKKLIKEYIIDAVYTNHDYEPYAIERDIEIKQLLSDSGIQFHTFKDQVIFEKNEVLKADGTPYTVYTPYSRVWKDKLNPFFLASYPTEKYFHKFSKIEPLRFRKLTGLGFMKSEIRIPAQEINESIIRNYHKTRNIPSINGTSRLSVHLRFGTISIRKLATFASEANEKYFNELIWREFYQAILWHFPLVVKNAFKPAYDKIPWRNNEKEFNLWCSGKTGYPIVDAGMRELNATGFMHNRIRMVVASFLTKHLLIDWRWGEAYFAQKLLDFELASNNGGWQWASGSGVDSAPYFRIFNPYVQTKNFDPELIYIRKWVPEFDSLEYPSPIVEHKFARERCLMVYKKALDQN